MSIQWTLVATFLYAEIGLVFVLIMPGISNQRWRRILKSRFLRSLENQAGIYFNVLLGILCLLFLDAIREMYAYSHSKKDISGHHRDLDQDMQLSMKTFRAQRNFYISGFSLLLWVVVRRLVTIICSSALTEINLEASRRQAEGAVKEAARLREELDEKMAGNGDEKGSGIANEVAELKDQLEEKDADLRRKSKELEAIKSQSEGLSKEYDRLLDEYSKMEKKAAAAGGDKKSD